MVFVKPFFVDGVDFDNGVQQEPDYDYEPSPRVFLGIRHCNGLGFRARYWYFDQLSSEEQFEDQSETPMNLQVQTVDLEGTQLVCLGPLNATFLAGARYSKVEHRESDDEGHYFEGFGPTFGMELLQPIHCTNFAVVGNVRGAMAFGETHFRQSQSFAAVDDDDLLWTLESQLGVEYVRHAVISSTHGRTILVSRK